MRRTSALLDKDSSESAKLFHRNRKLLKLHNDVAFKDRHSKAHLDDFSLRQNVGKDAFLNVFFYLVRISKSSMMS